MYMMSLRLNLQDTHLGVALPIAVTGFGIFLMRQFFITLPKDVEDAAVIDGCSDWGVLFRIVIPMSRPAITSLAIFAFVWSFEDFLWPLIITSSMNMRPIQIGIIMFQGLEIEWGPVMAAATLTIIPMLIFYICLQKYFVQGMTSGAVKG
jgi:ABC-type glycerol-3-phosphate transport system permease component